jgi:hypothetical protein
LLSELFTCLLQTPTIPYWIVREKLGFLFMWVWQFLGHHKIVCATRCFLVSGGFLLSDTVWQRCFLSHAAWNGVWWMWRHVGIAKKRVFKEQLWLSFCCRVMDVGAELYVCATFQQ